jgi:hypothetical protein
MVEHHRHRHQIDCDHIVYQSCFLLGFSDGCIPRLLALVEGTFGYDPPFAAAYRYKGVFDTFTTDTKREITAACR